MTGVCLVGGVLTEGVYCPPPVASTHFGGLDPGVTVVQASGTHAGDKVQAVRPHMVKKCS